MQHGGIALRGRKGLKPRFQPFQGSVYHTGTQNQTPSSQSVKQAHVQARKQSRRRQFNKLHSLHASKQCYVEASMPALNEQSDLAELS